MSESRKRAVKKYHQSNKGKLSLKKAQKKYESTDKGKFARKKAVKNRISKNKPLYNAYHRIWNSNKAFRLEILKERNFICFQCKNQFKNAELHCHHKIPILKNPKLAYEKSNILLVCVECHRKLHNNDKSLNNKIIKKSKNLKDFL